MTERIEAMTIGPDTSVGEALRTMDAAGSRILLVADADRRLLGVTTDGDLRRWIIASKGLDRHVSEVMGREPYVVAPDYECEELDRVMAESRYEAVPVVDDGGRIVDVVFWHDRLDAHPTAHEPLGMRVVIMAGGLGTRLAPFTNVLPKPLVPIGDKPITQLIMDRFAEWGCTEFELLLNHKASLIRAYFGDLDEPWSIGYAVEDRPLGTAGALSLVRDRLDRTFFLTNCDILVDASYAEVAKFHRESSNEITLVASIKHITIPYGVCEVADGGKLDRLVEKPSFDPFVSTGFYVVEPSALDAVKAGGVFHMTDLVNILLAQGRSVGVYPISEGSWLDMGAIDELQNMLKRLGVNQQ